MEIQFAFPTNDQIPPTFAARNHNGAHTDKQKTGTDHCKCKEETFPAPLLLQFRPTGYTVRANIAGAIVNVNPALVPTA